MERILGWPDFVKKFFLVKTKNDKKIRFWNFKNPAFLTNFDKFSATFCSNYDYEVILLLRSKKRFLSISYTPKDVFYSFLIIFWPSKNLIFCDFSMPNLPYKCDLSWAAKKEKKRLPSFRNYFSFIFNFISQMSNS